MPGLWSTPTLDRVRDGSSAAEHFHKGTKGRQERLARVAHFASSSKDRAELPGRFHDLTDGRISPLLLGQIEQASHAVGAIKSASTIKTPGNGAD
jgi:hypothetical protein